ncbi:hypothetical protein TUE45_05722 [Streptomyces reticuli]|nr:hypothetical protein TUE45_05722 [Streptomyces reticuli]
MQIAWPGGPAAGPKGDGGHADRGNRGRGRPRRPGHADRRSGGQAEETGPHRQAVGGAPGRSESRQQAVGARQDVRSHAGRRPNPHRRRSGASRRPEPRDRRPRSRRQAVGHAKKTRATPTGGRDHADARTGAHRQAAGSRGKRPGSADRRLGPALGGQAERRRRPADRTEATREAARAHRQAAEITPPGSRSRQEDPSHADRRPGSRRCADWGTPAGGRVTWEATRIRRQAAGAGAGRPGREAPPPRRQDQGHQGSSPGAPTGGRDHAARQSVTPRRPEPRRQAAGITPMRGLGHTGRRPGHVGSDPDPPTGGWGRRWAARPRGAGAPPTGPRPPGKQPGRTDRRPG